MAGKKVKKVNLRELLGERQSNAELYRDDPEKRKHHERHRTPRHRLITPKGSDYIPLAVNVERDIKLNELAREFISNGMDKVKAVAAVFGISIGAARNQKYMQIFDSTSFRKKIVDMMYGHDDKLIEPAKDFAIQRYMSMLNLNILDFFDDDGNWLSISEMRHLPPEMQILISAVSVKTISRKVPLTDNKGEVIRGVDGQPVTVEHVEQYVTNLNLPDKQKTMEKFSQLMGWIITHHEHLHAHAFASDLMIAAEARIRERKQREIEGSAERISTD